VTNFCPPATATATHAQIEAAVEACKKILPPPHDGQPPADN